MLSGVDHGIQGRIDALDDFAEVAWWRLASARVASWPPTAARDRLRVSATSAFTASMQVLRLFLRVLKSPFSCR